MTIESDLIEELLFAEESESLDFKRDQYPFGKRADKSAASELLKDILAFANSFRLTDAYILIGVEEVRGGRSKVVGVKKQLDDAQLQQFVNSKTQLPVVFSYQEATHDRLPIGIIKIPCQDRPRYAKKVFGKVKAEAVYVRRSSSTAVAKPDEVAQMGRAVPLSGVGSQPTAALHLVERTTGKRLESRVVVGDYTLVDVPAAENIPAFPQKGPSDNRLPQFHLLSSPPNSNFYREVADHLLFESLFKVTLELENTSNSVIHDASLKIELEDPGSKHVLMASRDEPRRPTRRLGIMERYSDVLRLSSDVVVERQDTTWLVECSFKKIRPHETVRLEDDLHIGSRSTGELQLDGKVVADNIPTPIPAAFVLDFSGGGAELMTVEDIVNQSNQFAG